MALRDSPLHDIRPPYPQLNLAIPQQPPPQDAFAGRSIPLESQPYTSAPPTRKQNTACDPCRSRKVRCNRIPGSDKCHHCASKGYDCTNFVQQATSEKRRAAAPRNRRIIPTTERPSTLTPTTPLPTAPNLVNQFIPRTTPNSFSVDPYLQQSTPTAQLLCYLFSPPSPQQVAVPPPFNGGPIRAGYYEFVASAGQLPTDPLPDWGEFGKDFLSESFRADFAADLVDVYFQICHPRFPMLDPEDFRLRLQAYLPKGRRYQPNTPAGVAPLPNALLATVIAWGAKFSEHPHLVIDRDLNGGVSKVGRALVYRAREIAEWEKVYRIPTPDHIVTAILLDPMHSQDITDADGFRSFWLGSAVRHMIELQVNRRSELDQMPDDLRQSMASAWWIACMADGYSSAYWRRKPLLDDDDDDMGMATDGPYIPPITIPPGLDAKTMAEFAVKNKAVTKLAQISRHFARMMSKPAILANGFPSREITVMQEMLQDWEEEYLQLVGVPEHFKAEWDFITAVSACTTDAHYHIMWVILQQGLDEFKLLETKNLMDDQGNRRRYGPEDSPILAAAAELERTIEAKATAGALRIANLVGVLTNNNYLRLDPNTLHYCTYAAGMYLARAGHRDVESCIAGLRQYSFAYEEAKSQADQIERTYNHTLQERATPLHHTPLQHVLNGHHLDIPVQHYAAPLQSPGLEAYGQQGFGYSR